ncbi:MAG TPA: hypothetical protein PKU97_24490, partial [Kofleriaceae bacterium]|nr:hypothetical protein [Kofleriaceae bacterium]
MSRVLPALVVIVLAGLVGLTAGCKSSRKAEGPSCRQLVSYMMRIQDLRIVDEAAAIAECRRQKWTAKQRTCMYNAKDVETMAACVPPIKLNKQEKEEEGKLPSWHPPMDGVIEGGPRPAPTAPAPTAPAATPAEVLVHEHRQARRHLRQSE